MTRHRQEVARRGYECDCHECYLAWVEARGLQSMHPLEASKRPGYPFTMKERVP